MMLFNYIAVAWFLTSFDPIQIVLDRVFLWLPENRFFDYIFNVLTCWKCVTFWTVIIWTQGEFITACVAALIVSTFNGIYERIIR